MSLPEVLLWNLLRRAPEGVVFRRQVSFGDKLTVDFYCAKARLCIEIDGIAHDMGNNPQIDEQRDVTLKGLGLEIVRIPASDVLKSPEDVASALVLFCQCR
jgi:very-short-patch-repair endonuclease